MHWFGTQSNALNKQYLHHYHNPNSWSNVPLHVRSNCVIHDIIGQKPCCSVTHKKLVSIKANHYHIRQNFRVGKLSRFFTQSRTSLNRESFPVNYGLFDWQCKSTSMLARKFSHERKFCTLTAKVFPLESFAVYGILSFIIDSNIL